MLNSILWIKKMRLNLSIQIRKTDIKVHLEKIQSSHKYELSIWLDFLFPLHA